MNTAHDLVMTSKPRLEAATLGGRIAEAFRNAGLNRTEFAKALGASYVATYDWTRDKYAPRADFLQRIARVTGYSASELLGDAKVQEDLPPALVEFLDSGLGGNVTDEEVAELLAFPWRGRPSLQAYNFALLAIREQLSPEDAKEAVRVSEEADRRAVKLGIKPPTRSPRRRN